MAGRPSCLARLTMARFRLPTGAGLMSVSSSVNITELIDRYPLGPFQIRIIVLCGLAALLDGFDLLVIGAAAPAMAEPLHIAPNQIGILFSAALFGLMLGAFGLGPIADRYGRRCVLISSTATFGVFTLCTAIAGTLQQVLLFRFFKLQNCRGAGFDSHCAKRLACTLFRVWPALHVNRIGAGCWIPKQYENFLLSMARRSWVSHCS
jgi:Major Facilitator Superfamily